MTGVNAIDELRRKAQRKQRRLESQRRDRRYLDVVGAFVQAKLLRTNAEVKPKKGPVNLKDVLWAGRVEPRLLELLPAVLIKKPAMVECQRIPTDLRLVLEDLRRNETPPDFRGVPGKKLQEWVPRVGHKGKLPTQLKAFRFRKDDLDLLEELSAKRGLTESDVVRAGLRALANQ